MLLSTGSVSTSEATALAISEHYECLDQAKKLHRTNVGSNMIHLGVNRSNDGKGSWIMYQDCKCSPSTSRINFERLQAPCANGWVCEVQSKRSSLLLHKISEMTGLVE